MSEGRIGAYRNPPFLTDMLDALLTALMLLHLPLALLAYIAADLRFVGAGAFLAVCGGMFLIRRYARRVWLFFPLHIILVAGPLVLGGADGVVYCLAALVMAVLSSIKRLSELSDTFGREGLAFSCALSVGAYAVSARLGSPDLAVAALALAVAVPAAYLGLHGVLSANAAFTSMGAAAPLARAHGRWLGAFACGAAALAFAVSQSGAGAALAWLGRFVGGALLAVLQFIFRLIFRGGGEEPQAPEEAARDGGGGFMPPMEDVAPNPILDIIVYILVTLICAALAAGVIYGLYKLGRFLVGRFNAERLFAVAELSEPEGDAAGRERRRGGLPAFGGSPSNKARRLFIWAVRKEGLRPGASQTAREIAGGLKRGEDRGALVDVYEKARYGSEPVTKAEYEAAKKAAGR